MRLFFEKLQLPLTAPSWVTGRNWILCLGLYKLTRDLEQADDWIWIVDHSVQIGSEKCLVILGIRLSQLSFPQAVSHQDVEPLAILPVNKSNGDVVFKQLEATVSRTGIPLEIVCDKGGDLNSGTEKFCQQHQETCRLYDIKHKIAAILKRELQNNDSWKNFIQMIGITKNRVQQTSLAHLTPPTIRSKARYMNVDRLLIWGLKQLKLVEQIQGKEQKNDEDQLIEAKIGWIIAFRSQLEEWDDLFKVLETTEQFVRQKGIYPNCRNDLEPLLKASYDRSKRVQNELLDFIGEESLLAKKGEKLLGTSEIIESVFGKFKQLESHQSKSGFTCLLLSIAAMVSMTTNEIVEKAMEAITIKKIKTWGIENLGKSVQARKKEST